MRLQVCAVRDSAIEAFNIPMFFRSNGEAIRAFIEGCAGTDTMFQKRPEHFTLWLIGQFDDQSGVVSPMEKGPEPLMTASDAVEFVQRRGSPS